MGRILRWLRALFDAMLRAGGGDEHDVEDAVYAGSRRLLELADAARTSAAQLVAARARLDREIAASPVAGDRTHPLEAQREELMRQQEAAEQQAQELAQEAAALRSYAEGMAAERSAASSRARSAELRRNHAMLARAARETVREAEDETFVLVARGRALDELRELEQEGEGRDLRPVRGDGPQRRRANP